MNVPLLCAPPPPPPPENGDIPLALGSRHQAPCQLVSRLLVLYSLVLLFLSLPPANKDGFVHSICSHQTVFTCANACGKQFCAYYSVYCLGDTAIYHPDHI